MPNPVEAYRKLQKKREKEKLRKNRIEVREATKLLQEPEKLKKELDELSHKSIIGREDEADSLRREKLEKLWEKHSAQLNYVCIQPEELADSKNASNEESSSDDFSDSDGPKCVIEIGGKAIPNVKPAKRMLVKENLGEDFALELLANAPPMPQKVPVHETIHQPEPYHQVHRQKAKITLPPPPPPPPLPNIHSCMSSVPPPPPPPPSALPSKRMIAITIPKKETPEIKAVPLSSYFVPSQLRINRSNA